MWVLSESRGARGGTVSPAEQARREGRSEGCEEVLQQPQDSKRVSHQPSHWEKISSPQTENANPKWEPLCSTEWN